MPLVISPDVPNLKFPSLAGLAISHTSTRMTSATPFFDLRLLQKKTYCRATLRRPSKRLSAIASVDFSAGLLGRLAC
jgi:hypothetical protein